MKNKNFIDSLKNAAKGVKNTGLTEKNFQRQLLIVALLFISVIVLRVTGTELALIILTTGFVLSAELFNTAIEKWVDLIRPEYHTLAGHIKDVAAGAVLLASITAVLVGLIVFIPRILLLI
ncbi:diacylglycerol kinase family protein [Clostridium sp. 'deep sea']|uniref:diacylglycerol kinase n=1 Tax=Clostridium sp. 'deep sea' TaxID=2779445 RepID=UPI0018964F4A|nr:diacylglycerol kinase family protein [Clostridium sp. 'deep sea']QOR35595.1 diacylglycerol kinase family protein [Clostridium sp. 'deep sea']